MKKLFLFVALLCASVIVSGKQYCQEPLTGANENTILLSCELFGDNYRITVEGENIQGLGGSFFTINETQNVMMSTYAQVSEDGKKLVINVASSTVPVVYTPLYVMMPGEVAFSFPNDVEWGTCVTDDTKYTITVNQPASGGTIAADHTQATYGTVITLTATPASGKKLDAWDVKDAAGDAIQVSKAGTFVMPQSNVTVTATFKEKVVLTPATYFGEDEIEREGEKFPVLWSITRNADATLTFAIQVKGEIVGFVPQVNLSDTYHNLVADEIQWAYTQDDEFEEGSEVQGFFWLPYAGGVKRIDWTDYTIGASNSRPGGWPTGVEQVTTAEKSVKVIENGQIIIIKNGVRFNLVGQQIQ